MKQQSSPTDRASNDWHQSLDLLVILGTPRVPPEAIMDELIRIGDLESAQQDGQWGARRWETETSRGGRRTVNGSGYAHPDWQRAHEAVVRANLIQAVGRARSNQKDGIPALVFSDESLGLPVEDNENAFQPLSKTALDLWIWIEDQIAESVNNNIYTFCNFKTGEIVAAMSTTSSTTCRALGKLSGAGYLTKVKTAFGPLLTCWGQLTRLRRLARFDRGVLGTATRSQGKYLM